MDYEKLIKNRNLDNKFAAFLGIKATEIKEGYAKGEIALQNEYLNSLDTVHGGLIFTLADTIGGAAAISYGQKITTVSSDINYLKAIPLLDKIYAVANVVKKGRYIHVVEVNIEGKDGTLYAKATLSYFNMGDTINE